MQFNFRLKQKEGFLGNFIEKLALTATLNPQVRLLDGDRIENQVWTSHQSPDPRAPTTL